MFLYLDRIPGFKCTRIWVTLTIALMLTLGTAVMTAAISVGAYPSSPVTRTHFPTGPVRDVPKATSGNNTVYMAWPNNYAGH